MEVSPPRTTEQLLPDIDATVSAIVEQYIHKFLHTTDQNLTPHQKEKVAIFQDIIRNELNAHVGENGYIAQKQQHKNRWDFLKKLAANNSELIKAEQDFKEAMKSFHNSLTFVEKGVFDLTGWSIVRQQPTKRMVQPLAVPQGMPTRVQKVSLHFATNRNTTNDGNYFGVAMDENNHYGILEVNVPTNNKVGNDVGYEIDESSLSFFSGQTEFINSMKSFVKTLGTNDALLFVHGYNNSFTFAAQRLAQLVVDTDFKGMASFYSWPSQGELVDYETDFKMATNSAEHLAEYINTILEVSDIKKLFIVAHSMGNRVLMGALSHIKKESNVFQNVEFILAAADITVQEFKDNESRYAGPKNVYTNPWDLALKVSEDISDQVRLGQVASPLPLKADVIDAGPIVWRMFGIGHGYFAEVPKVISDIKMVMEGVPAPKRPTLTFDEKLDIYTIQPNKNN